MRRPRPRSRDDFDTVDVLLVEDDEPDVVADEVRRVLHELALESVAWRARWPGEAERLTDPEATAAGEERRGLARRLARRYRRRAVVGAVLAVAVAATSVVVDVRRDAARAATFAAMPAVLAATAGPPAERWRRPGRVVSDQHDALLVVDGASLQAVDPATGAVRWTASEAAGRAASWGGCFPVDESLVPDRAPVDDGAGPRGLVACGAGTPRGGAPGDAAAAVVVVDVGTGGTTHTVTTDGALLVAEPVGRDLLVAAVRPQGAVRVTRWDVATGTPRWDVVSPQPVLTDGVASTVERRPTSLTVGAFAVDLRSGEQLDAEAESGRPYLYGETTLPSGARATWSWRDDGAFGQGRVAGDDVSGSYALPGPPLLPPVTDGSDAGVLVVGPARGMRLRGLHAGTGRMRWTRPFAVTPSLHATALVDGVLLLGDGDTVTALDVRTGDSRWRRRAESGATGGAALTDGRVVLLPVRADDGALHLVACRVTDGTTAWRIRAPSGTVAVTVVDHRLVASTEDEVIGLG